MGFDLLLQQQCPASPAAPSSGREEENKGYFRQCKSTALPGRQHSLQSRGSVRQGSRRLKASMCWGSLEVKDLQLRRQLARACSQPPVGQGVCTLASQRGADVTPEVLTSASRHCFAEQMPPPSRRWLADIILINTKQAFCLHLLLGPHHFSPLRYSSGAVSLQQQITLLVSGVNPSIS